jgi:hypothetical protein
VSSIACARRRRAALPRSGVLFPVMQAGDARLTTVGRQWIVERRDYGQWRELGFVFTRVGIWQVCGDAGIVVGWDAEDALQALPERFSRNPSPDRTAPRAIQGGKPTKCSLKDLRRRYCIPCRPKPATVRALPAIRRCDIIDCPVWPYRLGFNPHSPQCGVDRSPPGATARPSPSSGPCVGRQPACSRPRLQRLPRQDRRACA